MKINCAGSTQDLTTTKADKVGSGYLRMIYPTSVTLSFYMKAPEVSGNHCHHSKKQSLFVLLQRHVWGDFFDKPDILQRFSLYLLLPFPTRCKHSSPTPGDQISIPPLAEYTWWYMTPWLQLICSQLICSLIDLAEDKRWISCSCYPVNYSLSSTLQM